MMTRPNRPIRYARLTWALTFAWALASCGGETAPDGGPTLASETDGLELAESDPNLAEILGPEALAAFEHDRAAREGGLSPEANDGSSALRLGLVTARTVYGYVRDGYGRPVSGIRVTAFDADPDGDDTMGKTFTDDRGYYEIHYDGGHWDPCPHAWTCWRPDIFIALSVRKWKDCRTYGWERVETSKTYSNWKLADSLRIELKTSPLAELQDAWEDRPACPAPREQVKVEGTIYAVKNCNTGAPIEVSFDGAPRGRIACGRSATYTVGPGESSTLEWWTGVCSAYSGACCSPVGWTGPVRQVLTGARGELRQETIHIGFGDSSCRTP